MNVTMAPAFRNFLASSRCVWLPDASVAMTPNQIAILLHLCATAWVQKRAPFQCQREFAIPTDDTAFLSYVHNLEDLICSRRHRVVGASDVERNAITSALTV